MQQANTPKVKKQTLWQKLLNALHLQPGMVDTYFVNKRGPNHTILGMQPPENSFIATALTKDVRHPMTAEDIHLSIKTETGETSNTVEIAILKAFTDAMGAAPNLFYVIQGLSTYEWTTMPEARFMQLEADPEIEYLQLLQQN